MEKAQVNGADAAAEDKKEEELTVEQIQQKLEGLYDKLPKIIARIDVDNPGESVGALTRLLSCFRQINELEEKLLPEGMTQPRLSLSRIYEMASNGGGGASDEKLAELALANSAFAEENAILADAVENLTFQLGRLRGEKAEELVRGADKNQIIPTEDLQKTVGTISAILARIENALEKVAPSASGTVNGGPAVKPLDERMIEGLSGLSDITIQHLMATPDSSTALGKILRHAGFAYDYKDLATVRILVAATLESNAKLAEAVKALTPAQEQMDRLQEVLRVLALYAGHEVRESREYKDALAQIDRLQAKVDKYEVISVNMRDKLAKQRTEFDLQETINAQKRRETRDLEQQKTFLESQILEAKSYLESLRVGTDIAEKEKLERRVEGLQADLNQKRQECDHLHARIEQLGRDANAQGEAHLDHMMRMMNRMRETENGLLVEKLEAEVADLRQTAESAHDEIEAEREKNRAFAERVTVWVSDPEGLREQIKAEQTKTAEWQKRAGMKWAFMSVAGCALLFVGFMAGSGFLKFKANKADVAPETPPPSEELINFPGQFFRDHCVDGNNPCHIYKNPQDDNFLVAVPPGLPEAGPAIDASESPAFQKETMGYPARFVREHCIDEARPCSVAWNTKNKDFTLVPPPGL